MGDVDVSALLVIVATVVGASSDGRPLLGIGSHEEDVWEGVDLRLLQVGQLRPVQSESLIGMSPESAGERGRSGAVLSENQTEQKGAPQRPPGALHRSRANLRGLSNTMNFFSKPWMTSLVVVTELMWSCFTQSHGSPSIPGPLTGHEYSPPSAWTTLPLIPPPLQRGLRRVALFCTLAACLALLKNEVFAVKKVKSSLSSSRLQ
ncbi:hypothetical protein EYF80_026487 [Liparis tanakae]|uniref:Uncharacterized protein n=1 Tax=Liparis tanakae TaxID=230148 RepID=A0A4Z2HCG0_9TELE|nr:hypothetical protein EYF80_026487 [Liparis tanakae]